MALVLALAAAPGVGRAAGWDGSFGSLTSLGEYAIVGGGVTDFTRRDLRDRFSAGGTWDLRLGIGSRTYLAGELAYVGSSHGGRRSGGDLLANGAEAVLRVQFPWETGAWLVEPFAFGGIGWSHLSLGRAPAGTRASDDLGTVPFGAGVSVAYRQLFLDARYTYRATFSEDLRFAAGAPAADLSQWSAGIALGYEF